MSESAFGFLAGGSTSQCPAPLRAERRKVSFELNERKKAKEGPDVDEQEMKKSFIYKSFQNQILKR